MNTPIVDMVSGEIRPLYGSAAAETGTLTISGSPTYSLLDNAGETVSGHADQPVTGYDASAAATVRAWKTLDTAPLPEGVYTILFKFSATASADGISRRFESGVVVRIW